MAWYSGAISGQVRFLGRIKDTIDQKGKVGEQTTSALAAKLKSLVNRVEEGVLNQKFNTSIAGLMEFVNAWREPEMTLSREHLNMFASLLSLFAPQTAKEIVQGTEPCNWPDVTGIDEGKEMMVTIAVQVSGKLRGTIEVSKQESENKERVVGLAMGDERVKKWVVGEPKKVIFIPGKLVNLVV